MKWIPKTIRSVSLSTIVKSAPTDGCQSQTSLPARHLRLVGHATLRGEPVDHAGKDARQLGNQIRRGHAGQARQIVDGLRAQRLMQLIRRDRLVLSGSDPRVDDVAVPALLKALQQAAEATQEAALRLAGGRCAQRVQRSGSAAPPNRFPRPPPPVARAARSAVAAIINGLARFPPGTPDPRTSSSNPMKLPL